MFELKKARANSANYKYVLEFPSIFRFYTNDESFLSKILLEVRKPEPSKPQKEVLVGRLQVKWHSRDIVYDILKSGERYRILSSESTDKTRGAIVSKNMVEKIDSYLRRDGKKRSAYNVQSALGVSLATVLNALKVLMVQKRVRLESRGRHGRQRFRALALG